MTEPRRFLQEVVEPNLADLDAAPDDRRRAFNAVAAVDALAGAVFWAAKAADPNVASMKSDDEYRAHLGKVDDSFETIRQAAKALKHGELIRGNPLVSGADAISVRSRGWGEGRYGEGRYGGTPQPVVDTTGGQRVIETAVLKAKDLLVDEMDKFGL